MANIILSGFFDEHSDSFDGQLKAMSSFGVKNIEIRHVDKKNVSILTKEEVAEVKAKLDNYGFGVSAIGSPLGKIKLDGDMDAHMETARRVFETANTLGAEYIRMFSFYAPEGKDITAMRGEVVEALGNETIIYANLDKDAEGGIEKTPTSITASAKLKKNPARKSEIILGIDEEAIHIFDKATEVSIRL